MKSSKGSIKKYLMIIIPVIVIAIVGIILMLKFNFLSKEGEENFVDIRTDSVVQQDISTYVSMTGTVVANESQSVYANRTGIEVLEVRVKVGDKVKKGDVLAVLDSSEVEDNLATAKKQLEVDKKKNEIKETQASEDLYEAKIDGYDSWKENDIALKHANTDFKYAQRQLNEACEDLSKAKEDLADARADKEDELKDLEDTMDAAKKAYEKAKDQASCSCEDCSDDACTDDCDEYGDEACSVCLKNDPEVISRKQAYQSAKDKYEKAKEDLLDENIKTTFSSYYDRLVSCQRQVESAYENIEKAQRAVDDAAEKRADSAENQRRKIVDADQAKQNTDLDSTVAFDAQNDKIRELEKELADCTITAPISGVITSVSMEAGNMASNDKNTICVIQDTSSYKVEGTIDEYDIAKIEEGMEAVIRTEATGDIEMTGKVVFVSPTPSSSSTESNSSTSAVYPVKILIDSLDKNARIGMTANTNVLLKSKKNVMTVPYDCVGMNGNGDYVIYAVEGGRKDFAAEDTSGKEDKKGGFGMMGGPMGGPGGHGRGGNTDDFSSGPTAEEMGKEIVVSVGLIADYYVEIEADALYDGMEVYVPSESAISLSNDDDESEDGPDDFDGPGFF